MLQSGNFQCGIFAENDTAMNEIKQWIEDPQRDYLIGVALFAKYSKNKSMANNFARGTARFWMGKLTYELGKLVRCADGVQRQKPVVHKTIISCSKTERTSPMRTGYPVPEIILAAKKEIASLYSIIDKMHGELYELGTSNSDSVVKKRKAILDKRIPIIERTDRLYVLKEDWFAGNADVLDEIREILSAPIDKQPSIKETVKDKPVTDVARMSDLELSKRKSQLRSAITKTKNMLDFQSIRKGNTPTPMPDGPKRTEFENKLKALQAEYADVLAELKNRK